MIDITGQVAIVTGASRGIGAATAVMLAKSGADVAVLYSKNREKAKKIVKLIEKYGKRCTALKVRVENYGDCRKIVRSVMKKFGRIDILVNNAGIWEKSIIGKMTPKDWHKTISINLTGTFNLTNLVVPIMKKQRYGRIINVSSTAGQRGEPFYSNYASSKGGIIAFTKSVAPELIKYGIWVNCVAPGWVKTDMTSKVLRNPSLKSRIIDSIPRGKPALSEEIAGPIVFLTSPLSNNIVGEILNINGGSVLCA